MDSGVVDISWVASLLHVLSYVVVVGLVLWMGFSLLGYLHRRAYNLKAAETTSGGKSPAFLDNTGRSEEIRKKAEAFDERMAAEATEEATVPTGRACRIVRSVTIIASVLTFVVAIVSAVARIQMYDSFVENLSSAEHFFNILRTYWLGATVAGLIILVQAIRITIAIKNNKVP